MRIRSSNTDVGINASIVLTTNGVPTTNYYVLGSPSAEARWMEDQVNPGFSRRRASGEVIMSPVTSFESTIRAEGGPINYMKQRFNNDTNALEATFTAASNNINARLRGPRVMLANMSGTDRAAELSLFGMSGIPGLESIVLAEALERATSSEALALVTAAEAGKTIDLFHRMAVTAFSLSQAVNRLSRNEWEQMDKLLNMWGRRFMTPSGRRRLLRQVPTGIRKLASAWLGFRYGLMATYYDVQSWISASSGRRRRAKFTSKRTSEYSSANTVVTNWDDEWSTRRSLVTRTRSSVVSAGVLFEPKALEALDDFGSTRILTTAWELIPMSFVFDWFADLGTRLSAYEGLTRVSPLGTYVSQDHLLTWSFKYWQTWKTPNVVSGKRYTGSGTDDGSVVEECRYRVRKANPQLSLVPRVDININWKRMLDGAALFANGAQSLRYRI